MRVPSAHQIQYLNPLDGQELTIQKRPNPTPHHILSERFKKSNSFEKEAFRCNTKIDKNEVVNKDGTSEKSEMEHIDDPFKDENHTDSSFGVIDYEKKVKIQYFDTWENYLIIF